ncbi:MAG: KilA-N domain-containing protein [Brachymonas sp.]|nr:KilA-N domain-containing protein [Brachymonas sp.]MBP8746995.1 KilA-N domain-containing protein [Brachymonas sp.]
MRSEPVVSINGGDERGSYACEELVYAYAMWISPEFHLKVIQGIRCLSNRRLGGRTH